MCMKMSHKKFERSSLISERRKLERTHNLPMMNCDEFPATEGEKKKSERRQEMLHASHAHSVWDDNSVWKHDIHKF